MANWLVFNFHVFNDSLEKGLARGEHAILIELILDGYTIQEVDSSARIKVPDGEHEFRCVFRYRCSTGVERYRTEAYMFDASEGDVEFTLNLYHLTYGRNNDGFDFGSGTLPVRPPSKGCYVATCVYGSYDCPAVWTLRRYRDYTLAKTWYGRLFIRTYYAISPTAVKYFGNTKAFKKFFTPKLNKLVCKLNNDGVENTPYEDIDW